jgi:hypothetical protein
VERKRYSPEFQRMVVERMRSCDNIGDRERTGSGLVVPLRGKPNSITSSQERKHHGRIPMSLLIDSKSIG